jgi:hypothetical protein
MTAGRTPEAVTPKSGKFETVRFAESADGNSTNAGFLEGELFVSG